MPLKDLENLKTIIEKNGITLTPPQDVRIVGASFGNQLQNKILKNLIVNNLLLFYLCAFATLRYFMLGN